MMTTRRLTTAACIAGLAIGALASAPARAGDDPEGGAAKLKAIKDLMFAEDLGAFARDAKTTDPPPWSHLAAALRASDAATAKAAFRRVLAMNSAESRIALLAWNGLRKLGEAPPPAVANDVLGVIVEVPQAGGMDTLAAYADGGARYLNQSGKMTVWELPADPRTQRVRDVIKAARPATSAVRLVPRRAPPPGSGRIRITLLTPGGMRAQDGSMAEISDGKLGPTLDAATKLLVMLVNATLEKE